ncbi:MAG TPA: DUF5522 domain-containing protein [Saprospiraceae bacterium]|nr:DUF5522 domain-containing protein [Saprospiraceae bacterium]
MKKEPKKFTTREGLEVTEDIDFYVENGYYVFTAHYLLRRGYCCQSGCRHCPYGFKKKKAHTD